MEPFDLSFRGTSCVVPLGAIWARMGKIRSSSHAVRVASVSSIAMCFTGKMWAPATGAVLQSWEYPSLTGPAF